MKTKKEKRITLMNVWDFKSQYSTIWVKHSETIISGINSNGHFDVIAGKEDLLRLTY